jgi:hypothetical protein
VWRLSTKFTFVCVLSTLCWRWDKSLHPWVIFRLSSSQIRAHHS